MNMEISPPKIREQLELIFASPDFPASDRLRSFLSFVVEEAMAGRTEQIKAYTIAVSVFGRPKDFDSMLDPIVRIEAGKLRKLLERYYLIHENDPVIIKIPLGTYIPVFIPGNPKTKESNARSELQVIMHGQIPLSQKPIQEKRPLVLLIPPDNISGNKDLDQLSWGLTDDILMRMNGSKMLDMQAIENPGEGLPDVPRASFILHGHIQAGKSIIRVYMTLTDAWDGTRIWTEKFDCPLVNLDILEFQEKIALHIDSVIMDGFGIIAQHLMREVSYMHTEEIDPYDASLYYKIWELTLDRGNFNHALQAEEFGLGADPYNPHLMAELSRLYTADYQFAYNQLPDNLDVGMDLAKLAVARDQEVFHAHTSLAHNLFARGRKQALEKTIDFILKFPNLTPHYYSALGFLKGLAFDLEEGIKLIDKGKKLNPVQPGLIRLVPFIYHYKNANYDLALEECLQLNAPTSVWDPLLRALVYSKLGQHELAINNVENIYALEPQFEAKKEQILTGILFSSEYVDLVETGLQEASV